MQQPIQTSALLEFGGSRRQLSRLFLSELLQPGMIIVAAPRLLTSEAHLVLHTGCFGALRLSGRNTQVGGSTYFLHDRVASIQNPFVHVVDPAYWLVFASDIVEPTVAFDVASRYPDLQEHHGAFIELEGRPVPVLEWHARLGFRGFTMAFLQQLMGALYPAITGVSGMRAMELVKAVVTCVLGELGDGEMEEILSSRNAKKAAQFMSAITETTQGIVQEAMEEDQREQVEKDIKQRQARSRPSRPSGVHEQTTPTARTVQHSEPAALGAEPSTAASSSSGQPPPAQPIPALDGDDMALIGLLPAPQRPAADVAVRTRRPLRPIVGEAFTVEEAGACIPSAPGCFIHIHLERAWKVKYLSKPEQPRSRTHTWGSDLTHRECLMSCLRWVWDVHTRLIGEACPFDLGDE